MTPRTAPRDLSILPLWVTKIETEFLKLFFGWTGEYPIRGLYGKGKSWILAGKYRDFGNVWRLYAVQHIGLGTDVDDEFEGYALKVAILRIRRIS